MSDAFSRGLYWAQLSRWFCRVDPDQILVLRYERCIADTAGELRRTFAFLGIDEDYLPGDANGFVNQTAGEKRSSCRCGTGAG